MKLNTFFEEHIIHNWHIKALCFIVAAIIYIFYQYENKSERIFTIPVTFKNNQDYFIVNKETDSVSITVKGDKEDIEALSGDEFTPYVDVTNFAEEGDFSATIQIERLGIARNSMIEVHPQPRVISITQEKLVSALLPIEAVITGYPQDGFEITSTSVFPKYVTVSGPQSAIGGLSAIKTNAVDISDRSEEYSFNISLIKPTPDCYFPLVNYVECQIVFNEILETRLFISEVVVNNLIASLEIISITPSVVSVSTRTPQTLLPELTSTSFICVADASSFYRPGSYTLPVYTTSPEGVTILNAEPQEVVIEVGWSP